MPIMSNLNLTNQPVQLSPEERMLNNERKRVSQFINQYQRNPKSFNKGMITMLEKLALQYQIPFKRVVPTAGAGAHIRAGLGGMADSIVFDLIPDSWYSDESTRTTANKAKIVGYVGQVAAAVAATALSGGAAAPTIAATTAKLGAAAKGIGTGVQAASGLGKIGAAASGIGKTGVAAAKLAGRIPLNIAAKTPLGRLTTGTMGAAKRAMTPYGAQQGWKWATKAGETASRTTQASVLKEARNVIKTGGGSIEKVVKGTNLSPENIAALGRQIVNKYGNKKYGTELLKQLKSGAASTTSVGNLSTKEMAKLVNKVNLSGNPGVTVKRIMTVAKEAKITLKKPQAEAIVNELMRKGATTMKEAIPHLVMMGGSPVAKTAAKTALRYGGFGTMDTATALGGAGVIGHVGSGLHRPSREELESTEDPYDPYNV